MRALWDGAAYREERYAALAVTGHRAARAWQDPTALGLYRHLVVTGAWWDYVDVVAADRVGPILLRHRPIVTPLLRADAVDAHLWVRRTAILAQLKHREETDLDLLTDVIDANLEGSTFGREFFVRKAIGWALRQHARVDPRVGARLRRGARRPAERPVPARGPQAPLTAAEPTPFAESGALRQVRGVYGPDLARTPCAREMLLTPRGWKRSIEPDGRRGFSQGRWLRRRIERPDRSMCWWARGGCRARPAGRPGALGPGRSSHVHRATRTRRRSRSSRCFSRQMTSPASAGLAPSATRYFTLPSNSPTTPSQPKSTYPIRPAASRTSFCSSGLGRLSRNIWTRDRLSPALMLNGSASAPTRRAVLRPRTRGGTASTSDFSSASEHSPCRRAWSAAATAVWRVPVRARSTTVLAAVVTRTSPRRTVSASRPTCGRTSDDPRPRCSVATSTRTASGHCSIRGSPQTAAAEVTANTGVLAIQAQAGGMDEGGMRVLGRQATPLVLGDPHAVSDLVPAAPSGSMPTARRSRPRRRMPASNGIGAAGPSIHPRCQNRGTRPARYPQARHRHPLDRVGGIRRTSPAQEVLASQGRIRP